MLYVFSFHLLLSCKTHYHYSSLYSVNSFIAGLGSSTVDQVLKYTKYPKYIPSTSTGQVLIFLKST